MYKRVYAHRISLGLALHLDHKTRPQLDHNQSKPIPSTFSTSRPNWPTQSKLGRPQIQSHCPFTTKVGLVGLSGVAGKSILTAKAAEGHWPLQTKRYDSHHMRLEKRKKKRELAVNSPYAGR